MSNDNERYYAEMESARNISTDAYFEARPDVDTPGFRSSFKAGFERAFAMMWARATAMESALREIADFSEQRESKPCAD